MKNYIPDFFFFLNIFIVTLYFQPFLQYINKFLTSKKKYYVHV